MFNRKMTQQPKELFEIIDEAVHLLRFSPANLSIYYIGTMPFILGILYFWADMSRNAFGQEYCAGASLGLAMLFIWMKCWQTVFALRIRAQISNEPSLTWSFARIRHLVVTQTVIQSSGFLILPSALVLIIPFGQCYAFYQNVSAQDDGESSDTKQICKRAWRQAGFWPGQNCALLLVFSLFGVFVFLNLGITIFLIPHILKKFLGIETLFTMTGFSVFNTTFLTATCCVTYLCVDPLIKTVYALRCFYGSSLRSGDDLKAELKFFSSHGKIRTVMLIFFFLILDAGYSIPDAQCQTSDDPLYATRNPQSVSGNELDHSIAEIMNQRKFSWHTPEEKRRNKAKPGPFAWLTKWISDTLKTCVKTVSRWIKAIRDKIMSGSHRSREIPDTDSMLSVREFLFIVLIVLACILGVFFWRTWQKRKKNQVEIVTRGILPSHDLTDEEIIADALPADRWLAMAKELLGKGELRTAMRAFYLASLAHLAEHEMITIAKHKTNRDYERELCRRSHQKEDIPNIFSTQVTFFEKVWYGMYEVNLEDVNLFAENQKKIMTVTKW